MPLFIFAEASNMSAIPFSLVNTQIISYLILVRCKDCSMNDQIYTIYCFCISMGAWNCHFLFSRSMATIIHTEPLNRFFYFRHFFLPLLKKHENCANFSLFNLLRPLIQLGRHPSQNGRWKILEIFQNISISSALRSSWADISSLSEKWKIFPLSLTSQLLTNFRHTLCSL